MNWLHIIELSYAFICLVAFYGFTYKQIECMKNIKKAYTKEEIKEIRKHIKIRLKMQYRNIYSLAFVLYLIMILMPIVNLLTIYCCFFNNDDVNDGTYERYAEAYADIYLRN